MAKINRYEIILDEWHATELARMAEFDGFDDDLKYLTDVINSIIDIKKFDRPDYGCIPDRRTHQLVDELKESFMCRRLAD